MLQNLLSGACKVSLPAGQEALFGRMKCPTAADFRNQALYIWYDYFSVPQDMDSTGDRNLAVECIPSCCARAFFFLILSPSIPHADKDMIMSYKTWSDRGCCRLEMMVRALARDDGIVILVEDAKMPTLCGRAVLALHKAPGRGDFAKQSDKTVIAPVSTQMIRQKLQYYLERRDFHRYRFLPSMQSHYLDGLEVDEVEGLMPGFTCHNSCSFSFTTAKFLHETAFANISQSDAAGWSPLCYAAVKGKPEVVRALLQSKAHCHEVLKKGKSDAFLSARTPVLTLAAAIWQQRSHEVGPITPCQRQCP